MREKQILSRTFGIEKRKLGVKCFSKIIEVKVGKNCYVVCRSQELCVLNYLRRIRGYRELTGFELIAAGREHFHFITRLLYQGTFSRHLKPKSSLTKKEGL